MNWTGGHVVEGSSFGEPQQQSPSGWCRESQRDGLELRLGAGEGVSPGDNG